MRLPKSVLTGRTVEEVKAGVPATAGAPVPAFGKVVPQLATLVDDVPTRGDWVYELKYDGYRAIATLDDGKVRIASRNGKDWTDHFRIIADALSHVRARNAVFDGEIAYVMEDGRTDFQKLQNTLNGGSDAGRLVYFGPPSQALEFFGVGDFADIYAKIDTPGAAPALDDSAWRTLQAPGYWEAQGVTDLIAEGLLDASTSQR